MNRFKKCLALFLSLCIGTYALPVFATVTPAAVKTVLQDAVMTQAVGGTMDAQILTPFSGANLRFYAVASNTANYQGACLPADQAAYALEVIDGAGTVVQTLASGPMGTSAESCKSLLVTGDVSPANFVAGNSVRLTVWDSYSYPVNKAVAVSRKNN